MTDPSPAWRRSARIFQSFIFFLSGREDLARSRQLPHPAQYVKYAVTCAVRWPLKVAVACCLFVVTYLVMGAQKLRGAARTPRSVLHVSIISHKPYMLSRLARKHGMRSDYLALNTTGRDRLSMGWDYNIPAESRWCIFYRYWYMLVLFPRYDVIHYHFNSFLFYDGLDLKWMRWLGKLVVCHFRGCDVRSKRENNRINPALNACQECDYPPNSCDTEGQRNLIAVARRWGDVLLVTTPDLLDFVPEATHLPFIEPTAIDLGEIEAKPRNPGVFRVVTSSNHPGIDGVPHIRSAVERLAREGYAIELVEVVKVSFAEAIAWYKSADVYAGKLRMGYYNNANIETLILGVPNICYIRDEFRSCVTDSPIIVATPITIYEKLKWCLDNKAAVKACGDRGPDFISKHHDRDMIFGRLRALYEEGFRRKTAGPS